MWITAQGGWQDREPQGCECMDGDAPPTDLGELLQGEGETGGRGRDPGIPTLASPSLS